MIARNEREAPKHVASGSSLPRIPLSQLLSLGFFRRRIIGAKDARFCCLQRQVMSGGNPDEGARVSLFHFDSFRIDEMKSSGRSPSDSLGGKRLLAQGSQQRVISSVRRANCLSARSLSGR